MDSRATVEAMLRPDLRGRTAYGAPQLDVPVALNTNESSYAVPRVVVDAVTAAVAAVSPGLNRYPDREFTGLRESLAAYLSRSGTIIEAERVWAGNGSNEVLLHLLQAFGGPGRTALGFTPAYSMHPIITTTTGTTWVDGLRGVPGGGAFDLDVDSAMAQVRQHRPDVVFLCSPNNPTGTALDLEVVLAAWFHDAVYDALPEAEERSAVWAEQALPNPPAAEVARLVRITAHHRVDGHDPNAAVLSDADLAILAAPAERYAAYRVGYHRGLDLLRQSGWRGSGYVRWAHPSNRGFLRCLVGLSSAADAIGELGEVDRLDTFITQLDPAWDRNPTTEEGAAT